LRLPAAEVERHRILHRPWCHLASPALELKRFTRQRRQDGAHAVFEPPDTSARRDAEHLEFPRRVPDAEDGGGSSVRQDVQRGEVLGEVDGIVQRQEHRTEPDAKVFRDRGEVRRHHEGRGRVPVLGPVVLPDQQAVEPVLVCPMGHFACCLVQVAARRTEGRRTHVKANGQFKRHEWHQPPRRAWRQPAEFRYHTYHISDSTT